MRIDISFLPPLAAAFILLVARVGTMLMLLPGLGELNVPVNIRLTVALLLAAVLLPLHQSAYQIDLRSFGPMIAMLGTEMFIGAVLGLSVRLIMSSLQVAGAVIAQQMGLGFVTAVDPTLGQQGVIVSLFQALTQIQETTLVFVPKIIAMFLAMLIALPFMADLLQGHMLRIAARIVAE